MCVISACVLQLQVEDEQGVSACTESSLTLRRLLVWMYDPKVRLKTLAALVDFCQGGSAPEFLANAFHLLTRFFFFSLSPYSFFFFHDPGMWGGRLKSRVILPVPSRSVCSNRTLL